MKKTLLFLAILAVTSFAKAQPRMQRNPEEVAKRQSEMLEKRLGLSADQKAKIYDLTLSQAKSRDSLMTAARNGGGDRKAMMEKMRAQQNESQTKIKAVLNDTQKAEFDKWQQERMDRMRQGMRERGAQNNEG